MPLIPPAQADTDLSDPEHARYVSVARQLHHSDRRVIGLLPLTVLPRLARTALQLATVLQQSTHHKIALISLGTTTDASPTPSAKPHTEDIPFAMHWIKQDLALIHAPPHHSEQQSNPIVTLSLILQRYRYLFHHLLVDLSGYEASGDYLDAISLLDGVLLIVKAGHCNEKQLIRLRNNLPATQLMGALLLDKK